MIKIHHSESKMKTLSDNHAAKLLPLINKRLNRTANTFLKGYFISDNLTTEILSAKPRRLLTINEDIYKTLSAYTSAQIKDAANRVFKYESFKVRNPAEYRADDLCKAVDLVNCPYCNIRDIAVTLDHTGKVIARPPLDHFFSDSKLPLLALSFYNLIPCCTYCNTNFKLAAGMKLKENAHPYVRGFGDECTFVIQGVKKIDDILGSKPAAFEINFENLGTKDTKKKYDGNIDVFKLTDQYRNCKKAASLTVKIARKYSKAQLDAMMLISNTDQHEAFEMAFNTKFKLAELHEKPLSKLNRDLVKKYGSNDLKSVLDITIK